MSPYSKIPQNTEVCKGILPSVSIRFDSNGDAKVFHENTALGIIPSLGTQYTAQSSFKLRHQIRKMFLIKKRERERQQIPQGTRHHHCTNREGTDTGMMSIIHQYRAPEQPGPDLPAAFHSWILNSNVQVHTRTIANNPSKIVLGVLC